MCGKTTTSRKGNKGRSEFTATSATMASVWAVLFLTARGARGFLMISSDIFHSLVDKKSNLHFFWNLGG